MQIASRAWIQETFNRTAEVVQTEDTTVVTLRVIPELRSSWDTGWPIVGIAHRAPHDEFDDEIGFSIAFGRALIQLGATWVDDAVKESNARHA